MNSDPKRHPENEDGERVVVRDRRRIDPETGAVRTPGSDRSEQPSGAAPDVPAEPDAGDPSVAELNAEVAERTADVVAGMVALNARAFAASGFELVRGWDRFVEPRVIEVATEGGRAGSRASAAAIRSGCAIASRLGTSSPRISEKYERPMTTTAMLMMCA